jgi:hypothetical protein
MTVEAPTHYMGICDVCRSVKTFTSAEARQLAGPLTPFFGYCAETMLLVLIAVNTVWDR